MMIVQPFIPYRRHVRLLKKSKQSPPAVLPLSIVFVSDVSFDGPGGSVTIEFDVNAGQSLVSPDNANPEQWTAVFGGTLYLGSAFVFDGGSTLTVLFGDYGSDPGPNVLNYAADPSDIEDTQGRMLGVVAGYSI